MQASRFHKYLFGSAVVIVATCSGLAAWLIAPRSAPTAALPEPAMSTFVPPVSPSASASHADSLAPHEPPHLIEAGVVAEVADEGDAGPKSECGPLLWLSEQTQEESDRELLAEFPDSFPIYQYVRKTAMPFQDAVSALLPDHGNRGKCGQGATFGYDLQGGPAKRHCDDDGRCYWIVRATIIDDRSYHPSEKVHSALPWVYWLEVERIGAPVIIRFYTSDNESLQFTKISEAIRFIQELVRPSKPPQ